MIENVHRLKAPSPRRFVQHLTRQSMYAGALVAFSLLLGMAGYHWTAGFCSNIDPTAVMLRMSGFKEPRSRLTVRGKLKKAGATTLLECSYSGKLLLIGDACHVRSQMLFVHWSSAFMKLTAEGHAKNAAMLRTQIIPDIRRAIKCYEAAGLWNGASLPPDLIAVRTPRGGRHSISAIPKM